MDTIERILNDKNIKWRIIHTCFMAFILLVAGWLAIEMKLFLAFSHEQMSFKGFLGWTMISFAISAWLILSVPYLVFWSLNTQIRKAMPKYWNYMLGTY